MSVRISVSGMADTPEIMLDAVASDETERSVMCPGSVEFNCCPLAVLTRVRGYIIPPRDNLFILFYLYRQLHFEIMVEGVNIPRCLKFLFIFSTKITRNSVRVCYYYLLIIIAGDEKARGR